MVDKDISLYINETNFPKNAATTEITDDWLINKVTNRLTGGDKLKGDKLEIKGYPELKKVNLIGHEFKEVVIINCPILKEIELRNNKITKIDITRVRTDDDTDTGGPGLAPDLKVIRVGGNPNLEEISLRFCPDLTEIATRGNTQLDKVWGLDKCKKLAIVAIDGIIDYIHKEKLKHLEDIKGVAKELAGVGPGGKLDTTDLNNLKDKIVANASNQQVSQLQSEKAAAERERDEAKNDLKNLLTEIVNGAGLGLTGDDITKDKVIDKIKEIKQQATQAVNGLLTEINNLGLKLTGSDITKDKVFEKIRELINKPTTSCTHTDYDAIKAERDRLKNENKENQNKNSITKEVLVQNVEKKFSDWGIANVNKEQFGDASANEVEELRNKLIDKRFSEIDKEKKTALVLNITFGVLTIGSLLILGWLLMREATPKVEGGQDKKEKK